jgi:hypothetical protein
MLPPQSAMVIGPCPMCSEHVAVFCGTALPLDKEIFTAGTAEQKRTHLLEVIVEFLRERVGEAIKDSGELSADASQPSDDAAVEQPSNPDQRSITHDKGIAISEAEVEKFLSHDLNMIDNKDYFKAIFD